MPATRIHSGLHLLQEPLELRVNPIGHHILGDFPAQPLLLGGLISNDLLDRAVDVPAGIEERADCGHRGSKLLDRWCRSAADMDRAIVSVFRVEAEETQLGLARPDSRIEEDGRDVEFTLKLRLDS